MVLYKVRNVGTPGHEGTSAFTRTYTHIFTFSYVSLEIRRRRSFRSLLASPRPSIHGFKSYSSQFYVANLRLNNVILFTSGDE